MSVHYKFKSALDYDTVTFDGLHISVGDLKASISQQKRIGKTSDFDLQITNAQTKEVYVDDNTLIPKNTSLLVARVPLSQQPKKQWEGSGSSSSGLHKDVGINKGLADLSRMEGTEQEKINAMISQSTFDYDPSNYQKIRGQNQRGIVPTNYICYKCQKRGHWIKDCPSANSGEPIEIRRSTGIPRSFMVPVDGPKAPGAMMTPSGTFAVPAVDHEAYLASESAVGADMPANAPAAPEPTVPDELICSLCRDLLTDAVMIPCCGNSFCDECIRGALLESEDHECPDCREKEIAPTTLIPNRFLRNSVSSFRNQTGYSRRTPHRPCAAPAQLPPQELQQQPPNGPMQPAPNADSGAVGGACAEESDGSADDNITVTVPPAHAHAAPPPGPRAPPGLRPPRAPREPRANMHRPPRYGPPLNLKPPGIETPPNIARVDEQRASTPTIDERRDPMSSQLVYNRGPPPPFVPGMPPPASRFANPPAPSPRGSHYAPRADPYPPDPYQPPPPGIKDSPTNGGGDDPLEAFNRMIREKEMRAKLREQERRRMQSGSRSPRVRSRSPRSPRSLRSPRSPRSPLSPRPRLRSPVVVRPRYTRSRSLSRGRARRSPWSPRRRRSRDRSISLTRSPSPRRRVRSPLRYRSPLRSPLRSPVRSPVRSPLRSPARSPRSPRRSALRSPPPRNLSPHRFVGVYDELLSPPRRSVEPPYGARYGARSNIPPQNYPPMAVKQISSAAVPALGEPTGYRGRYDIPPYEDIPPGVDPPVPGFEPSPFEKPPFGPPGPIERDRIPPPNFRDQYRPPPYADGPAGYPRDMSIPPLISEIPVHVGEQSLRYRDNYRPGPPYRDQGAIPFRDGQPFRDPGQPTPYRDNAFRGAPQYRDSSFRNNSYRDGGFRENPPHNFREGQFRPPSADPREPPIGGYNENNYREAFRDDNNGIRDHRAGFRPNNRSRGISRRNPNEHDRHKEREGRDKDRYVENRDPSEKAREGDKRIGYEKSRDGREGREVREGRDGREVRDGREGREERREYDRGRDYERGPYEKDKERDHDRNTPDKKLRSPPKRSREVREKKRSESRDRLRESESKRDKKDERVRDKSSDDRSKEHKEKEKKIKERKKKKRDKEKEKESEKKKKRDRKEKKDKDLPKKENDDREKIETLNVTDNILGKKNSNEKGNETAENNLPEKISSNETSENQEKTEKSNNDLYGDEASEAVDKAIIETYVKAEKVEEKTLNKTVDTVNKDEPFDGIELQANADELDLKTEIETTNNKEMFAPLPELSKWEVDEDNPEKSKEPGEITSPEEEENSGKVTSEVIKRAENAIFAKAINSLRPIEIKKINSDRAKLYTDEADPKSSMNNIQITVPVIDSDQRSIEVNERKRRYSKTPPPRLSIKERLGGKVDDNHRPRDTRFVQSTVERVKSRSKTPKKEQGYRKVTVDRDRGRKVEGINRVDSKTDKRIVTDVIKTEIKHRGRSPNKESKRKETDNKISKDNRKNENHESRFKVDEKKEGKNLNAERERKKSTLDEAHFEPDYDETVESDNETKEQTIKKRDNSHAVGPSESKKPKLEQDTITLDLANVKKKPDTESESSSDTESSSSSSSSDARKRKKKKKRAKKKKKRTVSDSESETDSSSDDHKKKKKKRKHKKKSSKKKKRSKHK